MNGHTMAQSGETSEVVGVYDSTCSCRRAVLLIPGDRFPLCPRCEALVSWRTVWTMVLDPTGARQSTDAFYNGWDEC